MSKHAHADDDKHESTQLLGMQLASKALTLVGGSSFTVTPDLRTADPESLVAFAKFQKVLLMAFEAGRSSVRTDLVAAANILYDDRGVSRA